MQPFTSCLLAKINSPAFLKSCRADKTEVQHVYYSDICRHLPTIFHHTYFVCKHSIEFLLGDRDPFSVHTVHHHNDKLCRGDRNIHSNQQKDMPSRWLKIGFKLLSVYRRSHQSVHHHDDVKSFT